MNGMVYSKLFSTYATERLVVVTYYASYTTAEQLSNYFPHGWYTTNSKMKKKYHKIKPSL